MLFTSFSKYINLYAEAAIHPEDKAQFLAAFSESQLRLFAEENTSPACTVRRYSGEEYRWASFTLTIVNPDIILMFGMDSNEQHLVQERSDRYRAELKEVSLRNQYIISGVSDIFRLMLHIDIRTGETLVCSMHPDLQQFYTLDTVYQFDDIAQSLMKLVHPDDRSNIITYMKMENLCEIAPLTENKVSFQYRRAMPQQDPDINSKWTRGVFTITVFENGKPTEAIYAVQDIDRQKRNELEAQRRQDSLSAQFNTLIQNRFVWFIENDYSKQISRCFRITNHTVMPPMECPFGQFFERMIMPQCHPEDYKKAALTLLPHSAEEAYKKGKRQQQVDFRQKTEKGWRYVRAEVYFEQNAEGVLRSMIYISDVNDEVQNKDELTRSEHEQLILRRKFGMMIQDSFLRVSEVDLDTDTISYYHLDHNDFIPVKGNVPFSQFCAEYPERFIYPDQRPMFAQLFSYEAILRAARENKSDMKHLFLVDIAENKQYRWCNVAAKFFCDDNGKRYVMTYVEDVDDEIRKRDAHLHELSAAKEKLQEHLRRNDRSRIRKAHVFLNIASSFQLLLNEIYGTLDKMERSLPDDSAKRSDFRSMFTAYERLSAMTECAKDVLLLENNQLPVLKEPTSLVLLLQKMRMSSEQVFREKNLKLVSYATHVTEETVLCDSGKLSFLIENIFFNVIRSLPNDSNVTLQISQSAIHGDYIHALYEFSLVTHGDSVSQDIQSGLMSPIPANDPMKSIEEAFLLHHPDYQQHNLYLSKRLIALLNGSLEFVRLPAHDTAIILRLPLEFVPKQVIFPLHYTFGKRAFVWDSHQAAAIATMEMLRESGFHSDWQADFDHVCASLRFSNSQNTPYDLVVVRESDVQTSGADTLNSLHLLAPKIPFLMIRDEHASPITDLPADMEILPLKSPLFRSTLAAQLRLIFNE